MRTTAQLLSFMAALASVTAQSICGVYRAGDGSGAQIDMALTSSQYAFRQAGQYVQNPMTVSNSIVGQSINMQNGVARSMCLTLNDFFGANLDGSLYVDYTGSSPLTRVVYGPYCNLGAYLPFSQSSQTCTTNLPAAPTPFPSVSPIPANLAVPSQYCGTFNIQSDNIGVPNTAFLSGTQLVLLSPGKREVGQVVYFQTQTNGDVCLGYRTDSSYVSYISVTASTFSNGAGTMQTYYGYDGSTCTGGSANPSPLPIARSSSSCSQIQQPTPSPSSTPGSLAPVVNAPAAVQGVYNIYDISSNYDNVQITGSVVRYDSGSESNVAYVVGSETVTLDTTDGLAEGAQVTAYRLDVSSYDPTYGWYQSNLYIAFSTQDSSVAYLSRGYSGSVNMQYAEGAKFTRGAILPSPGAISSAEHVGSMAAVAAAVLGAVALM